MEGQYLIWSIEHNAWWKPAERGYTPLRSEAGLYTYQRAIYIVQRANMGLPTPNEAMVLATDEDLNR